MTSSPDKAMLVNNKQKLETEKKKISPGILEENIEPMEVSIEDTILRDDMKKGVIALSLDLGISNYKIVDPALLNQFIENYRSDPIIFTNKSRMKIIPLQRNGFSWHAPQSVRLRRTFEKKLFELINYIDSLTPMHVSMYSLWSKDILSSKDLTDDFNDVYGYVEKKPKKRRDDRAAVSMFVAEVYLGSKRVELFGMFDGDNPAKKDEWLASDFIMSEFVNAFMRFVRNFNPSEITAFMNDFIKTYNWLVMDKFSTRVGVMFGVSDGTNVYIINFGGFDLYTVKDGKLSLISSGDPSVGIGAFVQVMKKGRKKMFVDMSSSINVKPIVLDKFNVPFIVAVNSGIAKNITPKDLSRISVGRKKGKTLIRHIISMVRKNRNYVDDLAAMFIPL